MTLACLYAPELSSSRASWIDCSSVLLPSEIFATKFDLAFLPSAAVLVDAQSPPASKVLDESVVHLQPALPRAEVAVVLSE